VSTPDNWIHAEGLDLARPAVVLDLDGVISDATHRQSYLRDGRLDFDGFFAACVDDPVLEAGAALARVLAADHLVIILTARPETVRDQTIAWLADNRIRHDLLIMCRADDHRHSSEFKHEQLETLAAAGCEVRLAVDDSPGNVARMREAGVPTLSIHSGYYE
jgi:hypothetical protein